MPHAKTGVPRRVCPRFTASIRVIWMSAPQNKTTRHPLLLQTLRHTMVNASVCLAVILFRACGNACAETTTISTAAAGDTGDFGEGKFAHIGPRGEL
jgi:hypothetical protein